MSKLTKKNILEPVPVVRTLLLFLLKQNPNSSGYRLIKLVKEFTADQISLKTGTLYPELKKMVEEGILIQEEQVTGKRIAYLYCLTNKGEEELDRLITAIEIKKEVLLDPLIKGYIRD
ncbi:MAG: PadR family transcriptional regulator [Candidatus Heimdallarchaeota archaeon]|nr:PadR family transcriptional regulator [Candidatus Heimdallarchaeota archaeon]